MRDRVIIEVDRYYYEHGVYRWSPERRELAWRRAFVDFERALRSHAPSGAVITVGLPGGVITTDLLTRSTSQGCIGEDDTGSEVRRTPVRSPRRLARGRAMAGGV